MRNPSVMIRIDEIHVGAPPSFEALIHVFPAREPSGYLFQLKANFIPSEREELEVLMAKIVARVKSELAEGLSA